MSWTDGSWFVPTEGGADNSPRATGPAATTGAAAAEGATNADAGAQSNPFAILDTGNLYGGDEPPPLIDADVGGNRCGRARVCQMGVLRKRLGEARRRREEQAHRKQMPRPRKQAVPLWPRECALASPARRRRT